MTTKFRVGAILVCCLAICVKISSSQDASKPGCGTACPYIYFPVCGSNNVTYSSECVLLNEACHTGQNITVAHEGPCDDSLSKTLSAFGGSPTRTEGCSKVCPLIYAPVCGTDGVTYENECKLEYTACSQNIDIEIAHRGACRAECHSECTNEYKPVCGSDCQTYPNECSLELVACTQNMYLRILHEGACMRTESGDGERLDETTSDDNGIEGYQLSATRRCNPICTLEYRPVCGTNGVTYGNKCNLEYAACSLNQDILVFHTGPCTASCNGACSRQYKPVCGSDRKTYTNACILEYTACKENRQIRILYEGACRTNSNCKPCTLEYNPVCGSDGRTYGNKCALERAACTQNKVITVRYEGACIYGQETEVHVDDEADVPDKSGDGLTD